MNSGFLFGMLLFFTTILAIVVVYAGFAIYFASSRINRLKDELETAEISLDACKTLKFKAVSKSLDLSKRLDEMAEELYRLNGVPPKGYFVGMLGGTLTRSKDD